MKAKAETTHHQTDQITGEQVLATLELMNRLMRQESEYIKADQGEEIAKLQEKKQQCLSVIMGIRNFLSENPNFLLQQEPALLERLRKLNAEFETVSQENFALLDIKIRTNKIVADILHNCLMKHHLSKTGYNASGNLGHSVLRQPKMDIWVAVNNCA